MRERSLVTPFQGDNTQKTSSSRPLPWAFLFWPLRGTPRRRLLPCAFILLLLSAVAVPVHGQEARPDREELTTLLARATELKKAQKYAEALKLYEQAEKLSVQLYGADHKQTATVLNDWASVYKAMGQYAKAESLYLRSLTIREAQLGHDHPDVATSLNNLATLYKDMGQYAKAEPLYLRSLKIWEAKLGPDHPDVAQSLTNLANLYKDMGQYARAEPLYLRSLKIREKKLGPDHPDVARNLNNLAELYRVMGQYAKAEPLHLRGLKIREAQLGPDHADVAASLNNLALLYSDMGQYAKAEPLYLRSLKIWEAKLGPDHPAVANSLNNLALLYSAMGQYAKAEPFHLRSLKIKETKLGPDHPAVANSLNNLALLYSAMGQYTKAEPFHLRSLKIKETKLGPDHPAVANSLNNLAALYQDMGQYARAEPLYLRSLKIREAQLGPDHPDVALSLANLAILYKVKGQNAKAEPLYLRSLKIREAQLGPDHPTVATSLNNLALLHAALKRWPEAAETMERSRRIKRRHVARILPILSEKEQLAFLRNTYEGGFNDALSIGLIQRSDGATAARSAGWVLNGKAVAQQALAERSLLARDGDDPALAAVGKELRAVRGQLATLSLSESKPEQAEERRRQMARLAKQEQELSKKLGQAGGQTARADPWIELEEVRKALPAGAILIEISKFNVANFETTAEKKNRRLGHRYAAWVIPGVDRGSVKLIDLGPADRIENAVKNVRLALRDAQNSDRSKNPILQKGEPEAEKELRQTMSELSKLVLEPLLEHIGFAKHWIISPDAALWLVPWGALPWRDGTYTIENYQISYVVSGRDLVGAGRDAPIKTKRPIVMADPNYDLELDEARAAAQKLLGKPQVAGAPTGLALSLDLPLAARLPGTAAEAQAIKPKLERYVKQAPGIYKDKWALEKVFKAFRNPQVLVLCTHGFFLEDQVVAETARSALPSEDSGSRLNGAGPSRPALTKDGKAPENPLLRCGLLLAGCNQRAQKLGANDEDGVLTGLEIVGTDLRGTELVVLSACETGLGQVRNGEGVAGLRQAFQLAGAHTVVATLWQIPDRDSALLMSEFFENLAAGKSKADALREAQLTRIKARRERNGAAHPFFWAAFTLTGE